MNFGSEDGLAKIVEDRFQGVHGVKWVGLKEIPAGLDARLERVAGILIDDLRDQKSCQSCGNISVLIDPIPLKTLAQGRYV